MGYLVLQTGADNKQFTIIDGQQRITTISIVILAALHILKNLINTDIEPQDNTKRLETLKNTYIGFTDPISLANMPKLTLNRNNDAYFRNYLCALAKAPTRKIKKSERLLSKALEFFIEKLGSAELALDSGEKIAAFIDALVGSLHFTTIKVNDDVQAYKIFETLNARGVKLSVPDLVKNHLFSVIDSKQALHDDALRQIEELWGQITIQLAEEDFSRFIQTDWNSRNPIATKNILFRKIKQNINSAESANNYLRTLGSSAEVYSALQNPNDDFWQRAEYRTVQGPLKTLRMFNIIQPHGVLMVAYYAYEPKDFIKIARYIETISIRYNVIGRNPANLQESVYNTLARKISSGEFKNLAAIKQTLREIYPSDDDFKNDFVSKHMRTEQTPAKARYLLGRIEEFVNGNIKCEDGQLTLEHILPKNPNESWLSHFSAQDAEDLCDLLGNMTLLQGAVNKKLANASFQDKKPTYAESTLIITKNCAEYDTWDKIAIESRQQWLAEYAAQGWRIDFE